ncbi:YkgJ family cysteine cluster protein [Desulfonauticus submarinus]
MHCKRCAKCCLTSPPTLHKEDLSLIIEQKILKDKLIVLRKGEIIFDHFKQQYIVLKQELIKIVSTKLGCYFLKNQNCTIYEYRPIECKHFFCQNQQKILEIKNKNLLQRFDIINKNSAIGELISEHEQKCSLQLIKNYLKLKQHAKLEKIIIWDKSLRKSLKETLSVSDNLLNFYFGRPIQKIIENISHLIII